jgi:DNA-binding transcriptional LysR family regulator
MSPEKHRLNSWFIVHNVCMIDPRLVTLRAFAECGTVHATAELTGYSPSAVSSQLKELQRSLGMRLVTKSGRGLRLTSTGRALVEGSDHLMAEWERVRSAALSAGDSNPSALGLGGFSTAATNLLAPLAGSLKHTHPAMTVRVVEADPARCFDLLLSEKIDLAVIVAMQATTVVDPRFEQIPLLDDPLDVIVHAGHPAARWNSVKLADLAGEPWITGESGGVYHALFTAAFAAAGRTPHVAHHVIEWETSMALVEAGVGIGLLPRLAPLTGTGNVIRLELTGPNRPVRKIVAAVRAGSSTSPLIRSCLQTLRDTATTIMESRSAEEA